MMKVDSYKERYRKINETNSRVIWMLLSLILVGLAGLRYFYHLDAREAFAVDEPVTFSTAVGYLKTGTPYEWDFWNDRISDVEYGGIVPYLKLLALWMKLFGISLVSARSLSAVLGCLFILSCIYIIRKMFQRVDITVVAVSFIILNPEITYLFRFIRMYCLVMLLAIWFLYFSFMALTRGNHFKRDNRVTRFIKRNIDFNFIYASLAIIICYVSTQVHNIQMVMCGGMALFILYKAISGKEKKYRCIIYFGCICVFVGLIGLVFSRVLDFFPVIWYFTGSLRHWVSIGTQNNTMYFWDSVNAVSNQLLMILGWGVAVVSIFDKERKEDRDQLVYLIFIQVISIVFFVWFANNYYQSRYLCFILPISIIIFSYGFVRFIGKFWKRDVIIACLACVVMIRGFNSGFDYIYTLWDAPASQKVYERLDELYAGEEIDVLAKDFDLLLFGYFASQQLENVNFRYWGNYDKDNSFEDVNDFAHEYPQGLVWIQGTHLFENRKDQKKFLQKWTDRIAGSGIDNYNIEIGRLNYLDAEGKEELNGKWSHENFVTLNHEPNTDIYQLKLYGRIVDDETKFVCIKLILENENGEIEERFYQLEIPQILHKDNYCYEYMIQLNTTALVDVSNEYAVVGIDKLEEYSFGK